MKDESAALRTVRLVDLPGKGAAIELEALQIEVVAGPDRGRTLASLHPTVRIGNGPENDLGLSDTTVSRRHAELSWNGDTLVLRDLGSTNGVLVRGVRVHEAPLELPGEFALGSTTLRVSRRTRRRPAPASLDDTLEGLHGTSPRMRELFGVLRAAAPTEVTVLVQGESGTGKERVARALHALSGRPGAFVVVDAASADAALVRSELFGHRKGAFTGADQDRLGAFRSADKGTLFLDEVGELPPDLQARLLGVLERREVQPLGEDRTHPVDVRVVAATHRDLSAMVAAGSFRNDLYHRLAVLPVRLPSLRERPEDLPLLVERLLAESGRSLSIGAEAMEALQRHPWPGNVRELRNVLARAAVLSGGGRVEAHHLGLETPPGGLGSPGVSPVPAPRPAESHAPPPTLEAMERERILAAMERHRGDKLKVAAELGISMGTLRRRLKDYSRTQ